MTHSESSFSASKELRVPGPHPSRSNLRRCKELSKISKDTPGKVHAGTGTPNAKGGRRGEAGAPGNIIASTEAIISHIIASTEAIISHIIASTSVGERFQGGDRARNMIAKEKKEKTTGRLKKSQRRANGVGQRQ